MIRLTRSDPSRNMHRYYTLQLAPTLFGGWALVAEWGRIGSSGKVKHQVFQTEELAQNALEKPLTTKTKRGYRLP
jgi:predicted DNA-binding WGR domain protein